MRIVPTTLAALGAAGILVVAAPAFAAGPYTVKAGSTAKGSIAFTGASGQIQFKTSGGQNLTCSSSSAGGTVKLGTNKTGKNVAKITKSAFNGCTGPAGIALGVTQVGTWVLNATGAPSNGVTPANITKVAAHVADANGQCSFDVKGSVDGSFDANAQKLNITTPTNGAKLTISNVVGCFGLISNKQTATFTTAYTISNSVGPITITSP